MPDVGLNGRFAPFVTPRIHNGVLWNKVLLEGPYLAQLRKRSSSSPVTNHPSAFYPFLPLRLHFLLPEKFISRVLMSEKGRPLPKFGEWDVNDPASAEGFTVIFNKARDEKKTGGKPESPGKTDPQNRPALDPGKTQSKKWFCCLKAPPAES